MADREQPFDAAKQAYAAECSAERSERLRDSTQSELSRLRDLVREMREALHNIEVSANTVAYCYSERPENFAAALVSLNGDAEMAREMVAKADAGGREVSTDREQLELAAKAIGYELDWFPDGSCMLVTKRSIGDVVQRSWNPRTDDGDSFRLAVKLGLKVRWHEPLRQALVWRYSGQEMSVNAEDCNDDPLAATRLAIFRAAVEIGRNMK